MAVDSGAGAGVGVGMGVGVGVWEGTLYYLKVTSVDVPSNLATDKVCKSHGWGSFCM